MPSKVGANCVRNEDCINKNCVTNKCTRKTAKKKQQKKGKKIGEACNTNNDCINKNCVTNKCSRKTAKKSEKKKSPSPVEKVASQKSVSPLPSSSFPKPNNTPVKEYELKETVTRKQEKSVIANLKRKGATNGDWVYYTINDNVYHIIDGDKLVFVGISDENQGFDFSIDATKYTNDFFNKYKELLLVYGRENGVVELRYDDKFTRKYFDKTSPNNKYKVEVFDDEDEPGRFVEFSESGNLLRRVAIEGTFMDLLRGA